MHLSQTELIIPLTTNLIEDAYPLRVRVDAQENSDLLIDQIRAIDNQRLKQGPLTQLKQSQLQQIYGAVAEVLGARN